LPERRYEAGSAFDPTIKILVLREQHASLGPCPLHVFLVHGVQETSFRYGKHVNAAVPQATDDRPRHMLVRVEANSHPHRRVAP